MAVAESQSINTTHPVQARVPVDVYQALQALKDQRGISLAELVSELLVKGIANDVAYAEVIERALLRYIAKAGDPSEVLQLQETARFRGQSTLDLLIGHIRWGVQNGYLY